MYEHRTSILDENLELSVGEHFSKKNKHEGWKDFKFFVLEFCSTPADDSHTKHREAIERKWQYRLRCNYPGGKYHGLLLSEQVFYNIRSIAERHDMEGICSYKGNMHARGLWIGLGIM